MVMALEIVINGGEFLGWKSEKRKRVNLDDILEVFSGVFLGSFGGCFSPIKTNG